MTPWPRLAALLAALVLSLVTLRDAQAHGTELVGITVVERLDTVLVTIDRPRSSDVELVLPATCHSAAPRVGPDVAGRVVSQEEYHCSASLAGVELTVAGLDGALNDALFFIELRDGRIHRALCSAAQPVVVVPVETPWTSTLLSYVALGIQHLALGLDHLLFVLALVLVARRAGKAALALSAFTLGHSITLALSTLRVIAVPAALVEAAIALSLLPLALDVMRPPAPRIVTAATARSARKLAAMSAALGLVHGLGFASALIAVGLPEGDVALSLLGFNLGVELGQLAFAATVFGCAAVLSRLRMAPAAPWRAWLGHAIGALAAFWLIERLVAWG
jgi:hypothetical protein